MKTKWPATALVFEDATEYAYGNVQFLDTVEDMTQSPNFPGSLVCLTADGNVGYWRYDQLKPLTPAARAMLAIVKSGA